jgi:siroheme synthase (precorrin-2 oxidase/ferrochelatase)
MPHWNGIVETATPAVLKGCGGDPVAVRTKIYEIAPAGASVISINWESDQDLARVAVEGPAAERFLKEELEARSVVKLLSSRERKEQRG